MKRLVTLILLSLSNTYCFSQSIDEAILEKWIEKNNIAFNSPTCPEGFEYFQDCKEINAYRKINGDTIIIYSRGRSIAENIETLNKSIKDKQFNIYRYPITKQSNGTILVQEMRKWTFLSRNDTLFLFDDFDERKSKEFIKIMSTFYKGKISEAEYKKQTKENEKKDFGFVPQFKMVFFKGIFNDSNLYQFDKNQNFKKEKVTLIKMWKKKGVKYFKINLDTWTAGKYIISEDFNFINTEICEE